MAKKSTNFNRYRRVGNSAEDLVATLRALGMADEEIRVAVSGLTPLAGEGAISEQSEGESDSRPSPEASR